MSPPITSSRPTERTAASQRNDRTRTVITKIITACRVGAAMLAPVGTAGIGTNSAHAADGQVPFLASHSG